MVYDNLPYHGKMHCITGVSTGFISHLALMETQIRLLCPPPLIRIQHTGQGAKPRPDSWGCSQRAQQFEESHSALAMAGDALPSFLIPATRYLVAY